MSVFDLEGKLVIDYSELDNVQSEVDRRVAGGAAGAAPGGAVSATAQTGGLTAAATGYRAVATESNQARQAIQGLSAAQAAAASQGSTLNVQTVKQLTALAALKDAQRAAEVEVVKSTMGFKQFGDVIEADDAFLANYLKTLQAADRPLAVDLLNRQRVAAGLEGVIPGGTRADQPWKGFDYINEVDEQIVLQRLQRGWSDTQNNMAGDELDRIRRMEREELASLDKRQRAAARSARYQDPALADRPIGPRDYRFTTYRQIRWGMMGMAAGFGTAGLLGYSGFSAYQGKQGMDRSTAQVFGGAADEYKQDAEEMAQATEFSSQQFQSAQINLKKFADQVTAFGTDLGHFGFSEAQIRPIEELSAAMARTSGMPQFKGNLEATTQAVIAALSGETDALADFGIQMNDLAALQDPVNAQFAKYKDQLTPAQMVMVRYNYLMSQSNTIMEQSAEMAGDASVAFAEMKDSINTMLTEVGETIAPLVTGIANFIKGIPKPALKVGFWTVFFGGLVVGLASFVVALRALGRAAMQVAAQVAGSAAVMRAGGGGGGLVGKVLGKIPGVGRLFGGGAAAGKAVSTAAQIGKAALPLGGTIIPGAFGGGAGSTFTAAQAAATGVAGAGAVAAGVAVGVLGLEIAILKIADSTRKFQKSADDADLRAGRLQDQIAAKQTGLGDDTKAETMPYVAATYMTNMAGQPYTFFNRFGNQVTPQAQEWLRGLSQQQLANYGITVNINDKTYKGINSNDARSYANSLQ
jgi:hypothetical protein